MQCIDTTLALHAINRKSEKVEMGEGEICMQESGGRGLPDWVKKIESVVENNQNLNSRERDAHRRQAIYRVPTFFIRDEKRIQAYRPEMMSMGPYHHGEEQLLPMEEHKLRALRHFLVRTQKSIRDYREALRGVVQELMDSYKDLEKEWKDDEERFLQLMIFDGCFMIEVLRADSSPTPTGYDENDPIFSWHGMVANMPRIKRDMLMIENQIPLLVLKTLLSVDQPKFQEDKLVNQLVRDFFDAGAEYTSGREDLGVHVLDVVRKSVTKDIGYESDQPYPLLPWGVIWPATRLREAGIEFKRSNSTSLRDAKFDIELKCGIIFKRGILHLPRIDVDDATESKFLNLIAFEHLHAGAGKEVSSYVVFMDSIIDSEKDVSLLSQNNIIMNFVGTDQAVADLFHRVSHDVYIDPASLLVTTHQDVTRYCDTWAAKAASFRSVMFFNVWVWISSLGPTLLFVVTSLQLLYSMLDFYRTS